jgi:X-Pro dipeptidyl-peptidase C-terminal non-catalytic domain
VEEARPEFADASAAFETLVALESDLTGMRRLLQDDRQAFSPDLAAMIERPWTAVEFTDAIVARKKIVNAVWRFMQRYDLLLMIFCALHRESHEHPALLATGERYRVRIQLNDAGSVFSPGHKVRLAISTAYWPMIWPSPETATVQIFAGTLDLPQRPPNVADAKLPPFLEPETALPETPTMSRRDGMRIERIDRIGLESGTQDKTEYRVEENEPLSAVAELSHIQTLSRNEWYIRIETQLRMSSTANAFLLQGSLRAWEGDKEVCRRDWDRSVPRDFL